MHNQKTLLSYILRFFPLIILLVISIFTNIAKAGPLDRSGTLWTPYIEWSFNNSSFTGNAFDVVSTATFNHAASGTSHTTEMFYDSGTTWKLRFAGTKTGNWTFTTSSADPELNGLTGQVTINPNPGTYGFVQHAGNQWARQTTDAGQTEVFTPQFRMAFTERAEGETPTKIDEKIQAHMVTEGFNGLFIFVAGRWVDVNATGSAFSNNNPDPAMFQILENLITKVHAANGVVHIWYSGDCARNQCVQAGFGSNGARSNGEKRLLRYIGARLSPLPGWIMGYGYDIPEHAATADLRGWGDYLRSKMGWQHFLGARDQSSAYAYSFWPEADWHSKGNFFTGATLNDVIGVFESDTTVPHAFDERWWTKRINEEGLRQQLWKNMMGGGVSAIWGATGIGAADPFANPNWFKTHFTFWDNRYIQALVRDNSLTSGQCVRTNNYRNYVFYSEGISTLSYDLSNAPEALQVIAVDTTNPYVEISLGLQTPKSYTWTAPYVSDWALAVGDFGSIVRPMAPSGLTVQ